MNSLFANDCSHFHQTPCRTILYLQIPPFSNSIQISYPESQQPLIVKGTHMNENNRNEPSVNLKSSSIVLQDRATYRQIEDKGTLSNPLAHFSDSNQQKAKQLSEITAWRFKRISKRKTVESMARIDPKEDVRNQQRVNFRSIQNNNHKQKKTQFQNQVSHTAKVDFELHLNPSKNTIIHLREEERFTSNNQEKRLTVSTATNQFELNCDALFQNDEDTQSPKKIDERATKQYPLADQTNLSFNFFGKKYEILKQQYKKIPKNNTLKNIKNAFIRYIFSPQNSEFLNQKCQHFGLDFKYIQEQICTALKADHQHNKNIRYLLKTQEISPLFKNFLENSHEYWLKYSQLHDPKICQQMVDFLLTISENDIFIDIIQQYEKL